MSNLEFAKGLMALREGAKDWERIVYVDENSIGLEEFGICPKIQIEEVSLENDIRFKSFDGKLSEQQIQLIREGVLKVVIPAGTRYYSEDTTLSFGEGNANSKGNYIKYIREKDICINDGDGDTGDWGWTSNFKIKLEGNINDIISQHERINDVLELKDANQLINVIKEEAKVIVKLEAQIEELNKLIVNHKEVQGKARDIIISMMK